MRITLRNARHVAMLPLIVLFGVLWCRRAVVDHVFAAVDRGDAEAVGGWVSRAPFLLKVKGRYGWELLHKAVISGNAQTVQALVEKGADVNASGRAGMTPLQVAAAFGREGIAEFLLAKGADWRIRDKSGDAPIHTAARHGQMAVVELLLDKGCPVELRNRSDSTALRLAVEGASADMVALLLDRGAGVKDEAHRATLMESASAWPDSAARERIRALLRAYGAEE